MPQERELPKRSLSRIRGLVAVFIGGLILSGATAIPIGPELDWLAGIVTGPAALVSWLNQVRDAVTATDAAYPFLAYGTDWLAFGHFVIALAFVGAYRDPVRNRWLFQFGMLACGLVIPYALIFGQLRGIPFSWRLVDASFGVLGFLPLWGCERLLRQSLSRDERIARSC